jgi:hypothetical protein
MAMVMITEACVLGNKDLMTNHFAFVKLANAHLLVAPPPSLLGSGAILDAFMRTGSGIVACEHASVVQVYRVSPRYGAKVSGNILGWYQEPII